jgi:SAM-dependent methyltransferase
VAKPPAVDRTEQLAHFGRADAAHYRWQVEAGFFADTERALIDAAALAGVGRVLEIGCGEGANLVHLDAAPGSVGVDFAVAKLAFARREQPHVAFVCADAGRLPLPDAAFDGVLIRDVLHHVPDRGAVVREARRVLRPGGALGVIEPNRFSPLIQAQALLVPAERGVRVSDEARLRDELTAAGFTDVAVDRAQPLPLARLFHPRLGLDRVARRPRIGAALRAVDAMTARLVPRALWTYLVARARCPG